MVLGYALVSSILVSLISVIAAIPLLVWKKLPKNLLMALMSLSAGALITTVFVHFLPEAASHGYTLGLAVYLIIGFLAFFILEKFVHHHHHHKKEDRHEAHGHAYHLAPLNIVGDGIHNFIDGLVIAGSYAVSVPLGVAATVSVILHEVPQEIADFGILIYSGLSKKKALFFNFLSAITAILGVVVGWLLLSKIESFSQFIIPFAAGNFLYIAAANLVPELHRHCSWKDTALHVGAFIIGAALMILLVFVGPQHAHA